MGGMEQQRQKRCTSSLTAPPGTDMGLVLGPHDANLRLIEGLFSARVTVRGDRVSFEGSGAEVEVLQSLFSEMFRQVAAGEAPNGASIRRFARLIEASDLSPAQLREDVLYSRGAVVVRPKTAGQKRYADAIRTHTVSFGLGPAGTGKTYLAMALAAAALERKEVGRIVLARPIVEAGESLGFLPGTLTEKVDPYIRPLYDALFSLVGPDRARRLIDSGAVEIVPLAFMRGRTFNDSFIILDEAQNATPEQLKMFLTRLGFGSTMVITGDDTQFDIPRAASGLAGARAILEGLDDIAFCDLSALDVVRHSLVARIVAAYERTGERG